MSASVSPSPGSGLFLSQQSRSSTSSNMRLPPVNELFRMTDRVSDHNRLYGYHASTSTAMPKPPEDFIDLTSASPQDTLSSPNHQRLSGTSSTFPNHSGDPHYIDLDLIGMTRHLSRDPSAYQPHRSKRRRRDDSNDFMVSVRNPAYTAHTISSLPHAEANNGSELDMRNGSRDGGIRPDSSAENAIPHSQTGTISLVEPEEEEVELRPKDQQDRQLAETIKAQAGISNNSSKLNQLTCIICMDNMTNMTATVCGHVFCHTCIMEALIHGETRTDGRPAPKCPMCRTKIRRKPTKGPPDVVPLALKLMTRKGKTKEKDPQVLP